MSRGGWSGHASFTFAVERWKDPSGQYFLIDDPAVPENVDDEDSGWTLVELELQVKGSSYFTPGVTWRLPEDCYPDEGEDEIESCTLNGQDWLDELHSSEKEALLEQLRTECQ